MAKQMPSLDEWMREAKADGSAARCGMFLFHNGVVRETPKAQVRGVSGGAPADARVGGLTFGYDEAKVEAALEEARAMPGIFHVRVWLNEGELAVGDDIMLVLVGGDIRPHVIDALQTLVGTLKNECVIEREHAAK